MIKFIFALFFIFILSACSVQQVIESNALRTTMVATGDLSFMSDGAQSFAWHPTLAKVVIDDRIEPDKVIFNMQLALKKALEAKGYRLVSNYDSPDLLVGFGLALNSEMSDNEILNKVGLVPGLSTIGVDITQYEKGSVLVALFNPDYSEPVWRVLAQGFTHFETDKSERQQNFDEFISSMLTAVPGLN